MLKLRRAEIVTTGPSLGPPPRVARVRRGAWLVGTLVPAFGIALAAIVWHTENDSLDQLRLIVDAGQEAPGEVVGRRKTSGRRSRYLVTTRYRANGRVFTTEFESRSTFDRAAQQPAVIVSYDVDNPSLARLGNRAAVTRQLERRLSLRWWPPLLILAASVFFATYHWRLVRTRLSFARDGILRWGTVTSIRTFRKNARVTVSVDDGLGTVERTRTASLEFGRHQLVGSKAAVLSDPADPSRLRLCDEVMTSVAVDPAS